MPVTSILAMIAMMKRMMERRVLYRMALILHYQQKDDRSLPGPVT
jgi:hypothetical protein